MLVFELNVSAQAEAHGANAIGINQETLLFESVQRISRGRDRETAARQIPAQNLQGTVCLLYTSPSPRDVEESRMPSSA